MSDIEIIRLGRADRSEQTLIYPAGTWRWPPPEQVGYVKITLLNSQDTLYETLVGLNEPGELEDLQSDFPEAEIFYRSAYSKLPEDTGPHLARGALYVPREMLEAEGEAPVEEISVEA